MNSTIIEVMYSKIHRATVTASDLNYEGSISIDTDLIRRAKMFVNQKVDVYNCNNGARISTYVIAGAPGEICLNGAAARHVQRGDIVIIVAYASVPVEAAASHEPTVIFVDGANKFVDTKAT
jgi:aspartate 1-decarboxylase